MKLSPGKIFVIICLSFLAGVVVGTVAAIPVFNLYIAVLVGVVVSLLLRKKPIIVAMAIAMAFGSLGIMRMEVAVKAIAAVREEYNHKTIAFEGVVADEPQGKDTDTRISILVTSIESKEVKKDQKIKITATLPSFENVAYGDKIKGECTLEVPEEKGDAFSYAGYLASLGISFTCQKGHVGRVGEGEGSMRKTLLSIKNNLASIISRHMPISQASLLSGILMGKRDATPPELSAAFSKTGLTHIVAISGYNISLVIAVITAFVLRLGMHKKYTIFLIGAGVVLFILFTGMSSAAIRSGIMGMAGLLALQMGRLPSTPNALFASGIIMAALNPWIVRYDIGFQLSFLATLGLITLSPIIADYFKKLPETLGLKELLTQTMAAILITSPIIAWYFGTLSLIAPIANLLVVPLTPFIMATGFAWLMLALVFGLIPFVAAPLITFFSMPAYLALSYCIAVTKWLANIPYASLPIAFPLWAMALAYYVLCIWFFWESRKSKQSQDH